MRTAAGPSLRRTHAALHDDDVARWSRLAGEAQLPLVGVDELSEPLGLVRLDGVHVLRALDHRHEAEVARPEPLAHRRPPQPLLDSCLVHALPCLDGDHRTAWQNGHGDCGRLGVTQCCDPPPVTDSIRATPAFRRIRRSIPRTKAPAPLWSTPGRTGPMARFPCLRAASWSVSHASTISGAPAATPSSAARSTAPR